MGIIFNCGATKYQPVKLNGTSSSELRESEGSDEMWRGTKVGIADGGAGVT